MNLQINRPDLLQRVNAHIETGQFHNMDELIEKALDALEEKSSSQPSSAGPRRAPGRKSLVEVFAPLRGLDLDFSRNQAPGRPVDLT